MPNTKQKPKVAKSQARPAERRKPAAKAVAAPRPIDPGRILVREVMRSDVVVLRADDPIRTAAELFEDTRISGAPVVDVAGRLVGVLTVSDIARSEHVTDEGVAGNHVARPVEEVADVAVELEADDEELFATDDYEDEVLGGLRVADWMTAGVIGIEPEATLAAVCRCMVDDGIHRVFVVDGGRLVGVVSTEDVVRLLAAPGAASPPSARAAKSAPAARRSPGKPVPRKAGARRGR